MFFFWIIDQCTQNWCAKKNCENSNGKFGYHQELSIEWNRSCIAFQLKLNCILQLDAQYLKLTSEIFMCSASRKQMCRQALQPTTISHCGYPVLWRCEWKMYACASIEFNSENEYKISDTHTTICHSLRWNIFHRFFFVRCSKVYIDINIYNFGVARMKRAFYRISI